ncbi:MAG: polysaccharide biosynthesis tyrosine autokinase [Bdellovibrionota bacterium]
MNNNRNLSIQRYTMSENLPAFQRDGYQQNFDSEEVQFGEYLRVFYKYRVIIGGIFVSCVIFSLIFAFLATPRYTAESTIRISSYQPVLVGTNVEQALQQKSQETNFLETEIQEIKSYSVADLVLEDEQIKAELSNLSRPGFFKRLFGSKDPKPEKQYVDSYSQYKNPISSLKGYLGYIDVTPVRRTSLVKISSTTKDPKLSAMLANKHALEYIEWGRSQRVGNQARGLEFLGNQADELREKVATLERELADYAEENSIIAVNKDENITAKKLGQLNSLLTAATGRRIDAESAYLRAQESSFGAGHDDSSTQNVRSELAKLKAEYSLLSEKFTDSYPRMKQLKSQMEQLERSVTGQRQEIIEGLQARFDSAKKEEESLKEELEQQKSKAFELSKKQVQYNILNRELTSSRELLQTVLKQSKETSLAVESNATNVSIVDYAVTPEGPSYPSKRLFLLIGSLAGLSLGVGLAFILHYFDNTIRTPEDVQQVLLIPSLGVVPSFELESNLLLSNGVASNATQDTGKTLSSANDKLPTVTSGTDNSPQIMFLDNPRSLAAEAYRTIRTSILLSQAGEPPRSILVTSAQSSEGKTTSSVNLAVSLASAGAQVALIDADLRRPSVRTHFNIDMETPGLVEVVTGQKKLEEVYLTGFVKRVTIIPAGSIPPNPAELLGSLEMAKVIDDLSEAFDYVVIDSPPILPVTDSVILSRYVDGVILVVKGGSTPKKIIRDARDRLKNVQARILGAIVNDVDVTGGDYYYYNRYYHSYYQSEEDESVSKASI